MELHNVITRSDGNRPGECWFGTFGHDADITTYFKAQREARQRAMLEDDD